MLCQELWQLVVPKLQNPKNLNILDMFGLLGSSPQELQREVDICIFG